MDLNILMNIVELKTVSRVKTRYSFRCRENFVTIESSERHKVVWWPSHVKVLIVFKTRCRVPLSYSIWSTNECKRGFSQYCGSSANTKVNTLRQLLFKLHTGGIWYFLRKYGTIQFVRKKYKINLNSIK